MTYQCPYTACGYHWLARTQEPKHCPRCWRWLAPHRPTALPPVRVPDSEEATK